MPQIFPSHSYLKLLLKKLCEKSNCQKIVFYGLENGRWFAAASIGTNQTVEAKATKELPELIAKENIRATDNLENVIVDFEKQEALALVYHHNIVVGAFHFLFSKDTSINKHNLEKWTQQFGNSISANRTFEQAVLHEDMNLYTYPYFFFSVREVAKQGIGFYTLIMRVSGYSVLDKQVWKHWNNFRNKFFKEYIDDSPTTAWLENDRILLNFKEESFKNNDAMVDLCRRFIKQTQTITDTRIHAALVQGENKEYNMDIFVQTLAKALQKAEVTGDFIIARRVGVAS